MAMHISLAAPLKLGDINGDQRRLLRRRYDSFIRRGFSHSTYAAFALREAIVFTFVERPGIFLKLDLCAVAAAFNFSRFAFSSLRMEARAPFTTAERLSAEMVSAASRNARAKAFVPRSARLALRAMS
jgi:hypothetical protein